MLWIFHVKRFMQYVMTFAVIKSPQSGVTLCFQFVSADASASASSTYAAKSVASHVKTVWAKESIGVENVLDDLLVTLGQGHGCGIDEYRFACLQDKVRTSPPITKKLDSYISVVMLITWLDVRGILLEPLFRKFRIFSKFKHSIGHISGMVGPIDVKRKGGALVGYWVTLTSPVTLTFDFSRSNFKLAVSQ